MALFKNSSIEKQLAIIASLLAVLAAIVGNPYRGQTKPDEMHDAVTLDSTLVKYVDALQLAGWIMEKKDDFNLIDLRSAKEFDEYHIPYAQNIIQDSLIQDVLDGNEKIVVCTQDEKLSKEAWSILKVKSGEELYFLKGGMSQWMQEILFPNLTQSDSNDKAQIETLKRISLYFGGSPKVNEKVDSRARRYLREGC